MKEHPIVALSQPGKTSSSRKASKSNLQGSLLTNADIAELLAVAAESAKMPLQKALRRASRKALMWPEEAATLVQEERSLTELAAIAPDLTGKSKISEEQPAGARS